MAGDIQCRSSFVVALVDVAARSQQQLEAIGMAVVGGNVNWRKPIVVTLVDVAARSQQPLETVCMGVLGGNENWRSAVVVAYGHITFHIQQRHEAFIVPISCGIPNARVTARVDCSNICSSSVGSVNVHGTPAITSCLDHDMFAVSIDLLNYAPFYKAAADQQL